MNTRDNRREGSARPRLVLAIGLVVLTALAAVLMAQQFRITGVGIGPDGRTRIQHESDPDSYFILRRGKIVTNIGLTIDMALGQVAPANWPIPSRPPTLQRSTASSRCREISRSTVTATASTTCTNSCAVRRSIRSTHLMPSWTPMAMATPTLSNTGKAPIRRRRTWC